MGYGAMPKVLSDSFKPFEIERTVVLKGGFLREPVSMPLLSIPTAGDFVRMDKRMDWLIKAIAGKLANRTALVRTTLLDKLRVKNCSALGRDADVAAAVAADDGHDDAMDALGISEDEAEQPRELTTKNGNTPRSQVNRRISRWLYKCQRGAWRNTPIAPTLARSGCG